ncbi:hypothetical protein DEO72_LG5g2050 [Vigna unguiculata]|uniref:Uncharacterized protein n=1 Tax=Vigna unguiculata TaxID=3917 RepID=A0A4D6LZQ9_VIGUN|nr:hypothetical protein DEO72_LG5g2050 [Vigna unguiculata]
MRCCRVGQARECVATLGKLEEVLACWVEPRRCYRVGQARGGAGMLGRLKEVFPCWASSKGCCRNGMSSSSSSSTSLHFAHRRECLTATRGVPPIVGGSPFVAT